MSTIHDLDNDAPSLRRPTESAQIALDLAEFAARGGTIQSVPIGVSGKTLEGHTRNWASAMRRAQVTRWSQ